MNSFFQCGPPFDSRVESFLSSWRSKPPEHGSTHHGEAWTSRSHMTQLSQHLDVGVFFLEDPGEFCQQTQVFVSVMFLNVASHIQEFLRTEGNGCLFQEW